MAGKPLAREDLEPWRKAPMTQRLAFAAAAGLAAFTVMLLGALGTYVLLYKPAPATGFSPGTAAPAQVEAAPAPSFQEAPGQSTPPSGPQPGGSDSSSSYPVSADDAA